MKRSPLVSIIIPTYNNISVISDAINCSINQTYKNIEIIVVDDGSVDGTERMLRVKYGRRLRYFRQENKGLSSARNTGVRYALGKYLQFLDADDLIDIEKISIQVKELEIVSELALAYCDYTRSDFNFTEISYDDRMSPLLQKEKPFHDIMMKWETELSIPHHCFLFKSSIFKKYGIKYDVDLRNHEDWDILMNIFALKPTVVYIDKKLATYRIRENSLSKNKRKMKKGYIYAIDKQIKKYSLDERTVKKLKLRKKEIQSLYWEKSMYMVFRRAYLSGHEISLLNSPIDRAKVSKRWPIVYKNNVAWHLYHYGAVLSSALKVIKAIIISKKYERMLNFEREIRNLGFRLGTLSLFREKSLKKSI